MTEELRKYELMMIFSGDVPEAQYEKELGDFKKTLKESVTSVTYEDNWGLRNLAFKIKRQQKGYYCVFNFEGNPANVLELRSNIRLNPAVLRHMLITIPDSYRPGHHEDVILFRDEQKAKDELQEAMPKRKKKPETELATTPREAEQLKTVEKKLEKILENPDLDIM